MAVVLSEMWRAVCGESRKHGLEGGKGTPAMESPALPYAIGEFSFSESGDILGAGDALYQVRPTPTGLRFVPAY